MTISNKISLKNIKLELLFKQELAQKVSKKFSQKLKIKIF